MRKFHIYSLLCLIFLLPTACSYIDNLGEDPNNAGSAPTATIMTSAMLAYDVALTAEDARFACIWSQQFTGEGIQWIGIGNYDVSASTFDWEPEYYGCIQQANLAISKLEEVENRVGKGIMTVVKAHMFGNVAALWGDVPFVEANRFEEGITNPVYDGQTAVYQGVQTMLDEAIAELESGVGSDLGADLIYGGDAGKWITAAHSLKARFFLHTGEYDNAITQAQMGISTSSDNMQFPHPTGTWNQDMNIWSSFLTIDRSGDVGATGAYLARLLDENSDTYRGNAKTDETARFAWIYTPASVPGEKDYGINVTDGVFAPTASDNLMSFAENQLILAEAHLRKGAPDVNAALEALNSVRQANELRYLASYSDYVIDDFDEGLGGIASIPGASVEDALLMEIVEEKYISLVGQIEVFNDLRRTGNMIGLTPTLGGQLPERFLLPEEEVNANANAPSPIPDLFTPTTVNQ